MASPTEAQTQATLQDAVELLDNFLAAQTVRTDYDALLTSVVSDVRSAIQSGADVFESAVASAVAAGQSLMAAVFRSYCLHHVGVPETQAQACLDRLYTYFVDNNVYLQSRGFTFGSPSFSGATGTGLIRRLTVDEQGFDLEAQHADSKAAKCVADANTGTRAHEEVFEFRGAPSPASALAYKSASGKGSGDRVRGGSGVAFRAAHAADSIIRNGNFASYSLSGTVSTGNPVTATANDSLTDWTVSDMTKLTFDTDEAYISPPGVSIPIGLELTGNVTLTQLFRTANVELDPNRPYWIQLALKRKDSADGTLTLDVGAKQLSQAVSSLTNDTWALLVPSSIDESLWAANLNEADADVVITYASHSTGSLVISELRIMPMFPFNGSWYSIQSGDTKFKLDDEATWSDSISSDSKIQKWIWLLFGRHLPHTADATQVTAAGGRTLTFATASDTITASTGDFTSDGYKVGMVLTVAGTSNNNGTYTITNVTATVITVSENLTDEGPLSSTATLDATATIADPS